jgi:hypothetical protein
MAITRRLVEAHADGTALGEGTGGTEAAFTPPWRGA